MVAAATGIVATGISFRYFPSLNVRKDLFDLLCPVCLWIETETWGILTLWLCASRTLCFSTPGQCSMGYNCLLFSSRKSFVWNFKELFRQGALYRALPTALVGAVPKAVIHYSILNFYINTFAPDGDMKKADGQTATVIGASGNKNLAELAETQNLWTCGKAHFIHNLLGGDFKYFFFASLRRWSNLTNMLCFKWVGTNI